MKTLSTVLLVIQVLCFGLVWWWVSGPEDPVADDYDEHALRGAAMVLIAENQRTEVQYLVVRREWGRCGIVDLAAPVRPERYAVQLKRDGWVATRIYPGRDASTELECLDLRKE